jgi:endonuclease/exonuclease/phosphatase (EEP) superfamily protein YafD
MELTLIILSILLIILSILPFSTNQHWVFRVPDFMKLQIFLVQCVVFIIGCFYVKKNTLLWFIQAVQLLLIGYHIFILMRYTKFWQSTAVQKSNRESQPVKIISCNIFQDNKEFHHFIDLVNKEDPDIILTMESNSDWEQAMRVFEEKYHNTQKVTLENTYGMHFYTRLKVLNIQTHFFVADDLPSIEAHLETSDGYQFVFFGVHPPPPSPTEEDNSKERDGDLLSVAKRIRDYEDPVVVTGDFNTVAWAKASRLFKKTSRLIDARIGRGILATFHANYWFFRVPLDLLFHSPTIFIEKLFTYPSVNSDHFPIGCTFHINYYNKEQEQEVKDLEEGEMQEVNELILEGKKEESENRPDV